MYYYRGQHDSPHIAKASLHTQTMLRYVTLKYVARADYNQIMDTFNVTIREEALHMLMHSCYSFFRSWEEELLRTMAAAATVKYFNYNRKIIKAGSLVKQLLILRKGLVKIIKSAPKMFLLRSDEFVEVGLDGKVKNPNNRSQLSTPDVRPAGSPAHSQSNVFLSQPPRLHSPLSSKSIAFTFEDVVAQTMEKSSPSPTHAAGFHALFAMSSRVRSPGYSSPISLERKLSPMSSAIALGKFDDDSDDDLSASVLSLRGGGGGGGGGGSRGGRRKGSHGSLGSLASFGNSVASSSKNSLHSAASTAYSKNSSRGQPVLASNEEWFTVATLMPDQVFGEVSILHQLNKFGAAEKSSPSKGNKTFLSFA